MNTIHSLAESFAKSIRLECLTKNPSTEAHVALIGERNNAGSLTLSDDVTTAGYTEMIIKSKLQTQRFRNQGRIGIILDAKVVGSTSLPSHKGTQPLVLFPIRHMGVWPFRMGATESCWLARTCPICNSEGSKITRYGINLLVCNMWISV